MTEFISKERIFANATKLTEILLNSESYANFHERLSVSDLDYNENKTITFHCYSTCFVIGLVL